MRKLHADHEIIFAQLNRIKNIWLSFDAGEEASRRFMLEELCRLQKFMEIHHEIEERFLFPALKPIFSQVQSGPHCSLHMAQRVIQPPLAKAKERIRFFRENVEHNQERMKEIESHNQIGSYISIPLEEHEAGAAYFALLSRLLAAAAKPSWPAAELALTVYSYLSLIDQHAAKEDQCLFPQCEPLAEAWPVAIDVPESIQQKWKEERLALLAKR